MEVTIKGKKDLLEIAKKYPKVTKREINTAIKKSTFELQREAMIQTPLSSGKLRSHIITKTKDMYGAVIADTDYAYGLEHGTKPHYVPTRYIKAWAKRKGITSYGFIKAVQNTIKKKGTKANPFMERARKRTQAQINQNFERAFTNIVKNI